MTEVETQQPNPHSSLSRQIVYYFGNAPRRKIVERLVGHFVQQHFEEVWPLRHYTHDAFTRKVLKIFEEPDVTQSPSRELFVRKQRTEKTLDDFMTRVLFLVR